MQAYKRIDITKDQVIPIAEKMRKAGVILTMIHGFLNEEGKLDVSWEYQVEPVIESYHVVDEMTLPSIGEIYDCAATWPERAHPSGFSCPRKCWRPRARARSWSRRLKSCAPRI